VIAELNTMKQIPTPHPHPKRKKEREKISLVWPSPLIRAKMMLFDVGHSFVLLYILPIQLILSSLSAGKLLHPLPYFYL
jgi:hypothetical protein